MVRERNERVTQAWLTAIIPKMKRPPKLDKFLIEDGPKPVRRQGWQHQLAVARQWHAENKARGK